MSSIAERNTVKGGELLPELDTSFELGGDEDTDFYEEPPCLCAQQIISSLFGTILGYLAILLTPAQIYFPVAIAQGMGITLGLIGSEKSNIKAVGLREPIVISIVIVLSTYIVITLVGAFNDGEISLGSLVWTSFVLSNLASCVRSFTRYPQYNNYNSPGSSNGSSRSSPCPSPQKTLKFKHSGDANDWYGKNSNIMKV